MMTQKILHCLSRHAAALSTRQGEARRRRPWAGVFLVLLHCLPVAAKSQTGKDADGDGRSILFRRVRVFDGRRIRQDHDVLVTGGRIVALQRHLIAPASAIVVDGRGRTLLPGLIDAHVHSWSDAARMALAFGVTTELDMFADQVQAREWRREQNAGVVDARADIFSAGTLVTAPGGHGTEFGPRIPTLTHADSALGFVDARIAEGSDWIKIIFDDGHSAGKQLPTLSRETLRAVIAAARQRNRLSVVHVMDIAAARVTIQEGASGLAHLFVDSTADLRLVRQMKARGMFVIPTLTLLAAAAGDSGPPAGEALATDPRVAAYLTKQDASMLAQVFPRNGAAPRRRYAAAEQSVRLLKAAGVVMLAGTDAGNPGTAHGASLHDELARLVQAGLTPAEALRAATESPARVFGLTDRGRIAPGLRADLLLVEGDPSRDITATRSIVGVWKMGRAVDREAQRQLAAASRRGPGTPVGLGAPGEETLVSDFSDGSLRSTVGSGWMPADDGIAGGDSKVAITPSVGALKVRGVVGRRRPSAWAGALFSPGTAPFSPTNLSSKREIVFRVRADTIASSSVNGSPMTLQLMAYTETHGRVPLVTSFTVHSEWREVRIPFSALGAMDGHDVLAIIVAGGPTPGAFQFWLDDVRLR